MVHGVCLTSLIDTGASVSLLRRDVLNLIINRTHRTFHVQHCGPLLGLGGVSLEVVGKTQISVAGIKQPLEVVVCDKLPHDMIIGDTSLRQGHSVIDLMRNELTWFSQKWPLRRHNQSGYSTIGPIVPETGNERINDVVRRNGDVFSAKGEKTGTCQTNSLRIPTVGPPICQRAYRMPLSKRQLVEDMITDMLHDDIIRPSSSAYASPILLIPKKDNEYRFCVDYRKLNAVTEADVFPLPLIQDIFDLVGNSTIFSTLDLKAGYHQLPVAEEDIHKTAFKTHHGLFEFKRVPFGLKSAPNFFQREMNKILSDLIGKCAYVYIDDILIFSKSEAEHIHHLKLVFDKLRSAGLKLKPTKCSFGLPEVKLLGYVLNKDGIKADPDKVAAIVNLKPPTTVKEVRSILGTCNYYRSSLEGFATIIEPLVALTRRNVRFTWNEQAQGAFEQLKALLTSAHVMATPDLNKEYKLYTDACDYAVGGILVQDSEDGIEKVIQYVSHTLTGSQRLWPTIQKEAFGVVYCIQKLRPYLFGARFRVFSDHKPIMSLFTQAMTNTRIQRWGVLLAEYGATIHYCEGKRNVRADLLSRIRNDDPNQVAIIDTEDPQDFEHFGEDDDVLNSLPLIHDGLDLHAVAVDQRKEFHDLWEEAHDSDNYAILNGVLYDMQPPHIHASIYPRLVLPTVYREAVIDRAHRECGHLGHWKTMHRIKEAYVWKSMRKDVRSQLRNCVICLTHNRHPQREGVGDSPIASYPVQIISMDLIGPLVESPNGSRYILTIIDFCTGWAEAFPLPNKTNECVWTAFANGFIARHGVPEVLLTDCGAEFTAFAFEKYLQQIGIEHRTTTPFHPQCNGKIEKFNSTIKAMIQKAVNNTPSKWESVLNDALLAYRASVSTTTGYTPHFLMTGRMLRMPLQKALRVSNEDAFGNRLDALAKALKISREMTVDSRKHNKERLERKANTQTFSPGDSVIIKAEARIPLTSRWEPRWTITKVKGRVIYLHHQQTGKTKVLNREKVRLVNPALNWDDCNPRPLRKRARGTQIRKLQRTSQENEQPDDMGANNDGTEPMLGDDHVNTRPSSVNTNGDETPHRHHKTNERRRKRRRRYSLSDNEAPPPEDRNTQPLSDQRPLFSRPVRNRTLTERARFAADNDYDTSDAETEAVTNHFRKRKTLAPTEAVQKKQRCEAIALCVLYTQF